MKRFALLMAFALVVGGCTGGGPGPKPQPATPTPAFASGGTLRAAMVAFNIDYDRFDPQGVYTYPGWELFRCCLLRTLLSYSGRSWDQGGDELRPDLATELPTVSPDGLTWTFQLRAGLAYAPPLQHVEITAPDIVRALEREARLPGSYSGYYSDILGFKAYARRAADSISGLQTPDAHTLRVTLRKQAADVGYWFALPASAPIPPLPGHQGAPMGVATGHSDGYGRFLVASGPYMVEGADRLDFSAAPDTQAPASGYRPGRSITLVRNPSWTLAVDPLRGAYPDTIEVRLVGSFHDAALELQGGDVDLLMDLAPDPAGLVSRLRDDPATKDRVFVGQVNQVFFATMNLAVPPFDDIHVRRAVSLAIDKDELRALLAGSGQPGTVAGHIAPDQLEGGLLLGYDRYGDAGGAPDLGGARREMAKSGYDSNHDGRCDDPRCNRLPALTRDEGVYPSMAEVIKRDLARIGLRIHVRNLPAPSLSKCEDPSAHVPLCLAGNWAADYPSPENFFTLEFGSGALGKGCCNDVLLGASRRQLQTWGYGARTVPNVDGRIDQCLSIAGGNRTACWADLDKYLMDEVVPWIPYLFATTVRTVSDRVAHFSFDQWTAMPALDQIALKPGSS